MKQEQQIRAGTFVWAEWWIWSKAAARLPHSKVAEEEMSVKAELAFDVCWEVYRGAREVLETKRGVAALDWQQDAKYLWRPDLRPKLKDWVADFALAGQAALREPERSSRMVMFRLYYLGLAEYERARHFLGLSERSWVSWSEEIRKRCGEELLRRGMFPPRKYFNGEVDRMPGTCLGSSLPRS